MFVRTPALRQLPALLLVLLCACSVTRSSLYPVTADVERAATLGITTTTDSLNKGFHIYLDKCSGCHNLHKPKEHSLEEWDGLLPKMIQKARLDSADGALVKAYIFSKS